MATHFHQLQKYLLKCVNLLFVDVHDFLDGFQRRVGYGTSATGYSGIVQLSDDELYVVNYILDDAPKGQIRGYSINLNDFFV